MSSEHTTPDTTEYAIEVNGLGKCYQIYDKPSDRLKQMLMRGRKQYYKEFWALKDVSFKIKKGETVGIIGRNGSGKSTLLQMICGTLNPTDGEVKVNGRVAALLELGAGFNPEFSGVENVYMAASLYGLSKEEVDQRFEAIATFADIGDHIHQPVKTYSSGMYVRLAFSVAIHVEPEILIIDEALSVGDAFFQAKCASMIRKIIAAGATVLFVSHDTASIKSLCSRAILLDSGRSLFFGEVNTAVEKYYSAIVVDQQKKEVAENSTIVIENLPNEHLDGAEIFRNQASFQRLRNGSAEFINVVILDGTGKIVESVTFGERVTLRQVFRVQKAVQKLGLGYHIRDKNGLDIIYSDSAIERRHIEDCEVGSVYVVDWSFVVFLQDGNYSVASMLSEPIDLEVGEVKVADFIPISTKFSVSRKGGFPIYAAAYWSNEVEIMEIKR